MNDKERTAFLQAIRRSMDLMRHAHAELQAAQSQCHGELYDHVEPMGKRIYELRIKAEWLEQVALGRLSLESPAQAPGRQNPDRRQSVDPRIEGIRKQLTSLDSVQHAPHAPLAMLRI